MVANYDIMSDSSSLKKQTTMYCSVFNFLCSSVALSGQIFSKSAGHRERLHQHRNTVYLASCTVCQHINTWPLLGLISTIDLNHEQSHQCHLLQQFEHCKDICSSCSSLCLFSKEHQTNKRNYATISTDMLS